MLPRNRRAYVAVTALAGVCALADTGCVQQRPSRNGVFNENQYIRKDFLIGPGDGSTPDEGWFVKSVITSASTPNPLANVNGAGMFAGAEGQTGSNFVHFQVTQDKLLAIDMREISNDPDWQSQGFRSPATVNAWPITNVDLKYRINLDGEKTNFYEENQELDWQVRQWVKINFAKNDLSDLFQFGANINPVIINCTNLIDASVSLVTDSFKVDTANGAWEFSLNVTVPIAFDDAHQATCLEAFGPTATQFFQMGRQNATFVLKTSFVRPSKVMDPARVANHPTPDAYVPFPIAEKDQIQRKYGAFQVLVPYRDPNTQLLGAEQLVGRFNPNVDIVYYFSPGMPKAYTDFFAAPGGLVDQTNAVLAKAGGKGKLVMMNYNDATKYGDGAGPVRENGDPRYSFVNWHSDLDNGSQLLGVAQFFSDPRTGETISASVNVFEGAFKDTVQQRLDAFLQTVGEEFLTSTGDFDDSKYPASCMPGQTVPLVPVDVSKQLNRGSTVYSKMQAYLQKPFANYGYLGPADFIPPHDSDFYNAYFAVLPYQVYADPQGNPFVTPDGVGTPFSAMQTANWAALEKVVQFKQLAAQVDEGLDPYDTEGPGNVQAAAAWHNNWQNLAMAVTDYEHTRHYGLMRSADDISLYSYFDVYQKNGRHCVGGKWESRQSYTDNLIQSLNKATAAHEFGHTLGLRHNFMGSVDQRNFPLDSNGNPTLFASSLMDYNQQISEAFFEDATKPGGWGPYDSAAIAWIYGNNLATGSVGPLPVPSGMSSTTASGQVSATIPWNDPLGFQSDGKTEIPFLYCSDEHTKYTPLCRRYDMGTTPAEIMANDIQRREWNYLWTNFRLYHKYFSEENYAVNVANDFNEMRRFSSLWGFDWSGGELTNTLRLIGTPIPAGSTAADYYNQLTGKFNTDISIANQLQATYHRAIVEQSSGERPYITAFDPFFGDVTQQGIQVDKVTALTNMTALWPAISNYDPSQAGGNYLTSVGGQFGDAAYTTVSQAVLADFMGASFATYSYAQLGPIATFANTTHSTAYNGDLKLQTWVGGWAFDRERDFLDFVHGIAIKYHFMACDQEGQNCAECTDLDHCNWDPRQLQVSTANITQSNRYNMFQGPDGRTYIWGYLRSRNQWVIADKDRNNATFVLMYQWTQDLVNGEDDGYNGASYLERPVRFAVDAFRTYDGNLLNSN